MAQHDDALALANRTRYQRAGLRAEVMSVPRNEGRAILADAIRNPPDWLVSVDALMILKMGPGIADELADEIYARTGSRGRRRLSELTPRQRGLLAEGLRAYGRPADIPTTGRRL